MTATRRRRDPTWGNGDEAQGRRPPPSRPPHRQIRRSLNGIAVENEGEDNNKGRRRQRRGRVLQRTRRRTTLQAELRMLCRRLGAGDWDARLPQRRIVGAGGATRRFTMEKRKAVWVHRHVCSSWVKKDAEQDAIDTRDKAKHVSHK